MTHSPFLSSSKAIHLSMTLMSDVHTGKPDDKKEKGGDKADDKVRKNISVLPSSRY